MKPTYIFILFLSMFLCIPTVFYGQEEELSAREKRKLKRQEKKEQREKQRIATANLYDQLVKNKQFVLEADRLSTNRGTSVYVTPHLNFILVDSSKAVIQTGSNTGLGANGIGGVTAEGRITKYEVDKKEKNRNIYIHMSISTSLGFYEIRFFINPGTKTTAQLTSPVSSGMLTFNGELVPLHLSRVYEGFSY